MGVAKGVSLGIVVVVTTNPFICAVEGVTQVSVISKAMTTMLVRVPTLPIRST